MPTLDISLPLPLPGCSPQPGGNWRSKSGAIKAYRMEAKMLSLQALKGKPSPFLGPVVIDTYWFMGKTLDKRYRPLDGTNANAALKAAIDGLVDARLIPADSHKWVKLMPPTLFRTKADHCGKAGVFMIIRDDVPEPVFQVEVRQNT